METLSRFVNVFAVRLEAEDFYLQPPKCSLPAVTFHDAGYARHNMSKLCLLSLARHFFLRSFVLLSVSDLLFFNGFDFFGKKLPVEKR